MKKYVLQCFFMVLWILALNSHYIGEEPHDSDRAGKVIPEDITMYVSKKLSGWLIPRLANFTPYWKMFLGKDSLAPFFVEGDFDGDGNCDIALLLEKDARLSLVALHKRRNSYYHIWIATDVIKYTTPYIDGKRVKIIDAGIALEHPGIIKGFAETERGELIEPTIVLHNDGIHLHYFETSSVLYYWDGTAYRSFHTSD